MSVNVIYTSCLKSMVWDFPGSSVVKTLHFQCRGLGSTAGGGTKILPAVGCSQKKKKKKGWCVNPWGVQKIILWVLVSKYQQFIDILKISFCLNLCFTVYVTLVQ